MHANAETTRVTGFSQAGSTPSQRWSQDDPRYRRQRRHADHPQLHHRAIPARCHPDPWWKPDCATRTAHWPSLTISYPGLLATGADAEQLKEAVAAVRRQIAFYGATPAYRSVLELHGWGDLHTELHRLSRLGDWDTMSGLIDDEVLNTVAVACEPDQIGGVVLRRFEGLVDRFTLYAPYALSEDVRSTVTADLHRERPRREQAWS